MNIHLRSGKNGALRAGVSGVYRCGSPWLCPTCSPAKAFERAGRVQRVASATYERGGEVALVVLTASHGLGTKLADGKLIVQTASGLARKGRAWVDACEEFRILGVVVGQEVTYSRENGFHFHQHLSVPVDGATEIERAAAGDDVALLKELVKARAQAAGNRVAELYKEQIRRLGGKVSDKHGCHIRVAEDAEDASSYTAKGSMAWEVSGGHKTETKGDSSLTPWDIAEAAAAGDRFMYARWKEYEECMPGTRSCVISPRLARTLGLKAATDAEKGEQIIHESDDIVGRVNAPIWKRWMRFGLAGTFLGRVEQGGDIGFDEAVSTTQLDADHIEQEFEYREENLRRSRATFEMKVSAAALEGSAAQLVAVAVKRILQAESSGTVIRSSAGTLMRVRRIVDVLAIERPDVPRLDESMVLSACVAEERRLSAA